MIPILVFQTLHDPEDSTLIVVQDAVKRLIRQSVGVSYRDIRTKDVMLLSSYPSTLAHLELEGQKMPVLWEELWMLHVLVGGRKLRPYGRKHILKIIGYHMYWLQCKGSKPLMST